MKEFRERMLHEFYWSGRGRHTPEEVGRHAREEFDAISTYLGDKPYFMGDQATSIDATLYAWLVHTIRVPFPSSIGEYGKALPHLMAYCDRMRDRYYDDFARTGR